MSRASCSVRSRSWSASGVIFFGNITAPDWAYADQAPCGRKRDAMPTCLRCNAIATVQSCETPMASHILKNGTHLCGSRPQSRLAGSNLPQVRLWPTPDCRQYTRDQQHFGLVAVSSRLQQTTADSHLDP